MADPHLSRGLSRRSFLRKSVATMAAVPLLGPKILAGSPNETLNVACIGVGGMGRADLRNVSSADRVRIVAGKHF